MSENDWEEELGEAISAVQAEMAKTSKDYEELYADYLHVDHRYTKIRDKVIEVACLKHILDKGDHEEETLYDFERAWEELEELVK